jgi:hypothetical protein
MNRDYIPDKGEGVFPEQSRSALESALYPVEWVSRSVLGDKAAET